MVVSAVLFWIPVKLLVRQLALENHDYNAPIQSSDEHMSDKLLKARYLSLSPRRHLKCLRRAFKCFM